MNRLAEIPWIPIILAVTLLGSIVTFRLQRAPATARMVALIASLVPLVYSIWVLTQVKLTAAAYDTDAMVHYVSWEWIPTIGANLSFGIDGISAPLIFLTGLLTPLVIWFSWDVKEKTATYMGLMLLLEFAVIGVFTVLDYFLFYIFWELVLLPMFFLILIWGGSNKRYAAVKFLTYTFIASLVMLLGIMALYIHTGLGTFDILAITAAAPGLSTGLQTAIFATFLVGFGAKMPLVPVHTWLPDAHVQAPTGGSVMLAGVLLKLGAYGFLRIAFPALPQGALELQPLLVVLALVSMVYTAFVALGQRDLKSMIAYSSISHMGAVMIGFASFTHLGFVGGQYMMFAHGLISPALFMAAGVIHHHTGTRLIPELGGLGQVMPKGVALTMVAFMASLGLPGFAGFVAEVLIFLAVYQAFGFILLIAVLAVPITAGFYLNAARRAFFGPLTARIDTSKVHDIARYEYYPMFILMALTLLFGVAPMLLTDMMNVGSDLVLNAMGTEFSYAAEEVVS